MVSNEQGRVAAVEVEKDTGEAAEPAVSAEQLEEAEPKPAAERIAELLENMKTRRRVLLGLIAFCEQPRPVSAVNARCDELQENDGSVYGAFALCSMLEHAGALVKTGSGGEREPDIVEIDGAQYWKPAKGEPCMWQATEEGLAAVSADDPEGRMKSMLERDRQYASVFQKIIELCSAPGGASASDLDAAIDGMPVVQEPRRYALYFYDKLGECECLEWKDAWVATDLGLKAADYARELAASEISE